MIEQRTYTKRFNRTLRAIVGAFVLFRVSMFVFDIEVSPSHCLKLGIVVAIGAFIYSFRPELDLAFQIQRAKASSEDEFTRYLKLVAGGIFLLLFFTSIVLIATQPSEIHSEKARFFAFLTPPFLASISPWYIAISRLLADSYRKI